MPTNAGSESGIFLVLANCSNGALDGQFERGPKRQCLNGALIASRSPIGASVRLF
jgi:hypothetical protein